MLYLLMPSKVSNTVDCSFYELDQSEIEELIEKVLDEPEDLKFKEILSKMVVKEVDSRISAEDLEKEISGTFLYEEEKKVELEDNKHANLDSLSTPTYCPLIWNFVETNCT